MTLFEELCLAKNNELAMALGWSLKPIHELDPDTLLWQAPDGTWKRKTHWTLDSAHAFHLMLQFECYPVRSPDASMVAVATGLDTYRYVIEKVKDYPDSESALRFAIVNAVLHKLRFDAERHNGAASDLEHALKLSRTDVFD